MLASNPEKFDKQKERQYPGGQNMGMANVTTSLVPPEYPHPKVATKMGEAHLTRGLEAPCAPPSIDKLGKTKLGESKLGAGAIPPRAVFADIALPSTQFCSESTVEDTPTAHDYYPKWIASEMDMPLPKQKPRHTYPHHQQMGTSKGGQRSPPTIKAHYPADEANELEGGHYLGAAHMHNQCIVNAPVPPARLRGTYSSVHDQRMGAVSEPARPVRIATKMGQSSVQLG